MVEYSGNAVQCLVAQCAQRMEGLRQDRRSFWIHWGQLAEVYLPRRYRWLVSPNQWNRGSQVNGTILDETGVLAARDCASGMMSGLTSPTKRWMIFGLKGETDIPFGPLKNWLDLCTSRALQVLSKSNFYTSLGTLYHDNVVFNSAAMLIYEDHEEVIRCFNPCLGEFFFATSNRQKVDTLYREYTYTVTQCVQEFGLENCSTQVQLLYQSGGASRQQEVVICHAIEPNVQLWEGSTSIPYCIPPSFPYREVYWEQARPTRALRTAGYRDCPFVGARWDITGNDAYGNRGPGIDGMPATRQLQVQQKRLGQAIEKMLDPPMVGSVSMRNEPASSLPGHITYVAELGPQQGFRPAYQVDPRVQEMEMSIEKTQARIKEIFYINLFLMISSLETVRTATEIDARKEEILVLLGPVIERFENEVLDPIIKRVFAIMLRRGLIPPPPPEMEGHELEVQYDSILARAAKAARTSGTERFLSLVGNLAGIEPAVLDVVDTDEVLTDYADALEVSPKSVRSPEAIAALRQKREAAAQQEQALAAAGQGAQAAKTLSETDVGGGQSALAAMTTGFA